MTHTEVSRRRFLQLVSGAVAGAYTLGNISQARSEVIWRPDRARNPYRWIGMFSIGHRIGCGFLIGDEFVLTAAHCLLYPPQGITDWLSGNIFYPATSGLALSQGTKPYGGFRVTNTWICREWREIWDKYDGTLPNVDFSQYDWAILKIKGSPGIGHFGLGGDIAVGDKVNVTGYPNGVSPNDTQQTHLSTVKYLTENQIAVAGFVGKQWHGMSGGPIFTWQENRGWCVVGVHSSANSVDGNGYHPRVGDYIAQTMNSYSG